MFRSGCEVFLIYIDTTTELGIKCESGGVSGCEVAKNKEISFVF